jgi:starch synthase
MAEDNPVKIAMFAAEASPYAKVGGLGDVVGALPKALEKLGASVTVLIPAYNASRPGAFSAHPCIPVLGMDIPMASSIEHAEVFHSRMDGTGVDVYRIASPKYFDRKGIYDDPSTREGYPDNAERYIFFMKAGIELLRRLKTPVGIIHCHDAYTALVPGLMKANYRRYPIYSGVGTLFTIHNLAHQGISSVDALDHAGIDRRLFYPMSPFEYWGRVNFMKAGIELADKVNTVSPNYSIEIQTSPELGRGLEGVLRSRREDLSGIVNGIDYEEWNPESDPFIPARFSIRDLSGKAQCKKYLLSYFRLFQSRQHIPLIGMVSRLADQKGFDLIAEAIEDIMALNLKLVVLGTGRQKYHDLFQDIARRFPGKIGVRLSFDNELAHKIEAGCDMFLMPSKFEPCGLNQLYSFRYGTIPIVRKTGGLADTVMPANRRTGTGFLFADYSAAGMMAAIKQALAAYSDPELWQKLRIRAMSQDWSWDRSARQYMELYRSIYLKLHPGSVGIAGEHR